ncbi:nucleoside triphosphate pyrophosphohydrolase [Actinomycetes bacterium M1A6_2h]
MGKLVRDLIPDIITASGRVPSTRILDPGQYRDALFDKLFEEASELREAAELEKVEELADVYEVVRALAADLGITMSRLQDVAAQKRGSRGGFDRRVWLD